MLQVDLSPPFHVDIIYLCYDGYMKNKKKPSKQVRVSLITYELLRRMAFKAHKPMTEIIDQWALSKKV